MRFLVFAIAVQLIQETILMSTRNIGFEPPLSGSLYLVRGYGLSPPRYVSQWLWMDANNESTTDVTLHHGFGARPVKADVQVRSPYTGFIYPGVKSAHNDNDHSDRGGVICLYGEDEVRLIGATNDASPVTSGYIIYTGDTSWTQENGEILLAAYVRVRLWHPDDFPQPSYTVSTQMAAEMRQGYDNYKELPHYQGGIPVLTVVQYYSTDGTSYFGHMVAEAQGTSAIRSNDYNMDLHEAAFIFGVNDTHIRLWASNSRIGVRFGMFSFCDGWGNSTSGADCSFREANVNISFWSDLESTLLYSRQTQHLISDSSSHEISTVVFDVEYDLIIVTSTPNSGVNAGFEFYGTGAAMTDGLENSAGLIYAYNEHGQVRLWHPLSPYCIIQVGPEMGENINNQCAQDVTVSINIWTGSSCAEVEIPNGVATVNNGVVTYQCNPGSAHTSGDLQRHCQSNNTWNGTLPVCKLTVYLNNGSSCAEVEILNGVATVNNGIVTYQCNHGSAHISGDLQRHCQSNSTWNGTLPVCKKCDKLETGMHVILDVEFMVTEYIAKFNCVEGYELLSGNLTRYCSSPNATWSGSPPVCGQPTTTALTTSSVTTTVTMVTSTEPNTTIQTTTPSATSTSTTSSSTTLPLAATASSVVTVCYNTTNVIYNSTALEEETLQIVANLTVDAKTTSKYTRSKMSIKDKRSSSMYIGVAGSLILGIMAGIFLLPDLINVVQYLCRSDPVK